MHEVDFSSMLTWLVSVVCLVTRQFVRSTGTMR